MSANTEDTSSRRDDLRWAISGGIAAGVTGFAGMAVVGTASQYEARRLLDAILPTAHFAASAYVAGGATILALMLTLITFSISHELEFTLGHYRRIRSIAVLTTAVIVGSVIELMFLSFPLSEGDIGHSSDIYVFYAVLFGGAVTGGAFISTVLMLFYAVRGLIEVGEDAESSDLVVSAADTS